MHPARSSQGSQSVLLQTHMPLLVPALLILLSLWVLAVIYLFSAPIGRKRSRLPGVRKVKIVTATHDLSADSFAVRTLRPPSHVENVMLVIAHPDDECMFFAPTLLALGTLGGYKLHVLCLSTGNAEGLGSIRAKELVASCRHLGVASEDVTVMDNPDIQDGFEYEWASADVAPHIVQTALRQSIHTILTFDAHGVSGHPNHRAVWRGVRSAVAQLGAQKVHAWQLESSSLMIKFVGPLALPLALCTSGGRLWFVSPNPGKGIAAMTRHATQWVWFRRLFVAFGRYTYVNSFAKIKGP